MRVFNRGRFSMGVLFIVLGAVFPFTYYPMDTPFAAWVAAGVLVALGIGEVILSRSHRFSRWEEINKTDERNQLVRYRTYGAVLRWTRWGCLVLILLAGYSTALTGNDFL